MSRFFYYQQSGGNDPWVLALASARSSEIEAKRPRFVTVLDLSSEITDLMSREQIASVRYTGPMYADFDCQIFRQRSSSSGPATRGGTRESRTSRDSPSPRLSRPKFFACPWRWQRDIGVGAHRRAPLSRSAIFLLALPPSMRGQHRRTVAFQVRQRIRSVAFILRQRDTPSIPRTPNGASGTSTARRPTCTCASSPAQQSCRSPWKAAKKWGKGQKQAVIFTPLWR